MPSAMATSRWRFARAGHDAGAIVGVRFSAEANHRFVDLRLAVDVRNESRSATNRTTSSPVANGSSVPACPTRRVSSGAANDRDDVVRRDARRFVDEQQSRPPQCGVAISAVLGRLARL